MGAHQLHLFHNTVVLYGDALKQAQQKCIGQNWEVLQVFNEAPDQSFTAWQMYDNIHMKARHGQCEPMLITSVRRAITRLTKMGYLEKQFTVQERHKAPNYLFQLKLPQ